LINFLVADGNTYAGKCCLVALFIASCNGSTLEEFNKVAAKLFDPSTLFAGFGERTTKVLDKELINTWKVCRDNAFSIYISELKASSSSSTKSNPAIGEIYKSSVAKRILARYQSSKSQKTTAVVTTEKDEPKNLKESFNQCYLHYCYMIYFYSHLLEGKAHEEETDGMFTPWKFFDDFIQTKKHVHQLIKFDPSTVTANDSKWKEDIKNNVRAKQQKNLLTSKYSWKELLITKNESPALLAFYKEDPNNFTLLADRMSGLVNLMESAKGTQTGQAGAGVNQKAMAASQLESKSATEETTPEKNKATHQGSVVAVTNGMGFSTGEAKSSSTEATPEKSKATNQGTAVAVTPVEQKNQIGAQPNQITIADHQQDNNGMGLTAGKAKSTSTEATPEKNKGTHQEGTVAAVTPAGKNQIAETFQNTTIAEHQQEDNGMGSTGGTKPSSTDKTAPTEDVTPDQDQQRDDLSKSSSITSRNNVGVETRQSSKVHVSF
jgi:hypothetical protein